MYLIDRHAFAERIRNITDAVGTRIFQLPAQAFVCVTGFKIQYRVKSTNAGLHAAQCFLHGFLEGSADCHHLTDRLHLRGQAIRSLRKFFESEARNFCDDIIDARLKRSRSYAAGNFIAQFIECVTHCKLGGNARNRKTGCLGGKRR